MSEWKEYSLGEIIEHKKGFAFKSQDLNFNYLVPVVKLTNTIGRKIDINSCDKVNENLAAELSSYKLIENDIIIATVGSWPSNPASVVGKIIKVDKLSNGALLNQNAVRIRKNGDINQLFIYYHLCNSSFQDYIINTAQGSANQASITLKDIFDYKLPLPPLPEQERIAEILSSLDDKIDLLQRQNKTLEEMAETLFRQWFENIEKDESSQIMNIEDVATVQNGYSFKSSDFVSEQLDTIEVLKMGHISAEGGLRQSPKKDFVKRNEKYNKWILNKRDIILAMTDMKDNVVILGVPALIDHDNKYVLNQRVGRIFLCQNSLIADILILYMQMKDKGFISELQSKANSGVQVNLGTDSIRQTKVLVPSLENQKLILPQLECIFNKLDLNRAQTRQLEILRDTLLPKIMSGEVRV